jgi:hypothetical protein
VRSQLQQRSRSGGRPGLAGWLAGWLRARKSPPPSASSAAPPTNAEEGRPPLKHTYTHTHTACTRTQAHRPAHLEVRCHRMIVQLRVVAARPEARALGQRAPRCHAQRAHVVRVRPLGGQQRPARLLAAQLQVGGEALEDGQLGVNACGRGEERNGKKVDGEAARRRAVIQARPACSSRQPRAAAAPAQR